MKKLYNILSLCLLSLCLIFTHGLTHEASAQSTIETIQKRKVMRVGFSSFVPWAMQNKKGEYIGFEIDVAKRLAKDLGVRYEPVPTAWSGIIPALLTNKIDVIIGGMGVTEERAKQVGFTIPYDQDELVILASTKAAGNLKSIEDFNKPEIVMLPRLGAPNTILKSTFPKATVRQFNDEAATKEELISGRAHAELSTSAFANLAIADNPKELFVPFELKGYGEPIAIAVKPNDEETLKVFNEWIEKVKAEGWLEERLNYWFKTKDWEKDL